MTTDVPFTIGIPTFNRAAVLGDCIERVLNQSFGQFELLIGDNASEDGTAEVVARFNDPRITYIRRPSNIGGLKNLDDLIDRAAGRYFMLHQDDDAIDEHFLRYAHEGLADEPDAAVFCCPMWHGEPGKPFAANVIALPFETVARGRATNLSQVEVGCWCLHTASFLPPAIAYRTDALRAADRFIEEGGWGSDLTSLVKVMRKGHMVYDPRIGGVHRMGPDTFTARHPQAARRRDDRSSFLVLIDEMDKVGSPWQSVLQRQLESRTPDEVLAVLRRWGRSDAPPTMLEIAIAALRSHGLKGRKLFRKVREKIGFAAAIRCCR